MKDTDLLTLSVAYGPARRRSRKVRRDKSMAAVNRLLEKSKKDRSIIMIDLYRSLGGYAFESLMLLRDKKGRWNQLW